LEQIKKY